MIPPTSIDGTDITGATIDGTDVQEITVDGDVVFTAVQRLPHFDDFDTNTLSDYEIYDGTSIDDSDFSIASSELQQAGNNDFYFIGYDVSSESIGSFFLEYEISRYDDNDLIGGGFVIDTNTLVAFEFSQQRNQIEMGEINFPSPQYFLINENPNNLKIVNTNVSFSEPFTQRMEYDGSSIDVFHNGVFQTSNSVVSTGSISLIGFISSFMAPGVHWDSIEIGTL